MRIAMVSEHASPLAVLGGVDAGGQNVHVAALATALAADGHLVDVYTRRDDAGLPDEVELAPGVRVVHVTAGPAEPLPKDDLLPHMTEMGDRLAAAWSGPAAPDVAHAHFWMSGLASLRASARTGVPVAQTFHALGSVKRRHQADKDTSPPERVSLEAMIGRRADAVVATCTDEVAELRRMGIGDTPVHVVPCGVDLGRFRPVRRTRPADAPFRLLSVGRLVERKGVDTAVAALAELPGAELVVAGGPPVEELGADAEAVRLTALARELGVADRVHLVGRVDHDDMPGLFRSADVVVATPWYEPFGIVPVEAAACGVPVVGSAVGGLLDTVQDGRTGLLVPPRDVDALVRALRRLCADAPLRGRLGRAAHRRAVELYGWDRVAARTGLVYADLAQGAPHARVAG